MLNNILQNPQKFTRIAIVSGLVLLVVFWFSSSSDSGSKQQRNHHPIEITAEPEQEDNQLDDDQTSQEEEETTDKNGEINTNPDNTDNTDETNDKPEDNNDTDKEEEESDNKENPDLPPNEDDDDSPVTTPNTDNNNDDNKQGVDPDDKTADDKQEVDPEGDVKQDNKPTDDQTTTPAPTVEAVDPDGDIDGTEDITVVDPDGDLDGDNANVTDKPETITTEESDDDGKDKDTDVDGVDETNPETKVTNPETQVGGEVDPDGDSDDEDYAFDDKDGKERKGNVTTTTQQVEPEKKKRNVFFDFGASNGVATEAFLSKSVEGEKDTLAGRGAEGEWEVYLVEANPLFEESLKKLEEKLRGEKRLKVTLLTNKAACPTAGNVTLLYDPECENCSGSADPTHKDYVDRLHAVKKKEVPCIPINELLTRYAVEDTVVMKVDVECMEMSLLKAILTAGTLPLIDEYAITWHEYCIDSLQVRTLQWILSDSPSKLLKWR